MRDCLKEVHFSLCKITIPCNSFSFVRIFPLVEKPASYFHMTSKKTPSQRKELLFSAVLLFYKIQCRTLIEPQDLVLVIGMIQLHHIL